ncbi:hypothetical protein [Nocardia sp. NPDC057455]|uniref:hypothetical protein n=1 Tax=Nocardia sp. NPDC057455 TaxID=3346138 RepID=UPI003671F15E
MRTIARHINSSEAVDAPGPLLRGYLGDRRFELALRRAVALQILHPAIAAALTEHVTYRLWLHKRRTVRRHALENWGAAASRSDHVLRQNRAERV